MIDPVKVKDYQKLKVPSEVNFRGIQACFIIQSMVDFIEIMIYTFELKG